MGSYSIFQENSKYGLAYQATEYKMVGSFQKPVNKETKILEPDYSSIEIHYKGQNIEELFHDKKQLLDTLNLSVFEDRFVAVSADGKSGLLCRDQIFTGLIYDRVIKLSYRHYLCITSKSFTIYRLNKIDYEEIYSGTYYIKFHDIQYEGQLYLKKLLSLLSERYPKEYDEITALIKPGGKGKFISEYNHFTTFVDDHCFQWAVQRVILNDDFSFSNLDTKYGAIASE